MSQILIADDDDILSDLLRYRLEAAGHAVTSVRDGFEAIESARRNPPDLVILDAMMPVVSGIEALTTIRSMPATADVPIMMLTVRAGEDDVVRSLRAGANDYLTKPFLPQELLARVEGLLRRPRATSLAG